MVLRSFRERIIQTVAYEVGGMLLAAPIYAMVFGGAADASLLLMATLSMAELIWSPIHNILFDLADRALAGRVASDRPHAWRVVHAVSTEATSAVLTVPILITLGGRTLGQALAVDIGLTLLFTLYAFAFHLAFDRLRPVARNVRRGEDEAALPPLGRRLGSATAREPQLTFQSRALLPICIPYAFHTGSISAQVPVNTGGTVPIPPGHVYPPECV